VGEESLDALELIGVELPAKASELAQQAGCVRAATLHSGAALELLGNERGDRWIDRNSTRRVGNQASKVFEQTVSALRIEQKPFWDAPDLRLSLRCSTRA
jgi:hypothetical protein